MSLKDTRSFLFTLLVILVIGFYSGCSQVKSGSIAPSQLKPGKQIAVVPVIDKTGEPQLAPILREKAIEELYFKGYPKIPSSVVDAKISKYYKVGAEIQPQVIRDLLGADAVLYCTLAEWKKSVFFAYGSISAKAEFELRSTKNGELIWKDSKHVNKRNWHILKNEVRVLTLLDYETAIQDLVDEAMESFPNGPNFIAQGPPKKSSLSEWF